MFKKFTSVLQGITVKFINGIDPIDINDNYDVSIRDASSTQKGACLLSTDTDTIAGIGTGCITPTNLKAKLGDQTANLVAVGKGNDQVLEYWSFYSSDGTAIIDPDIDNKRFNIKSFRMSFVYISSPQELPVNKICVFTTGDYSYALPTISSINDIIELKIQGATSYSITQSDMQKISVGESSTTTGTSGNLTCSNNGSWLRLICTVANKEWMEVGISGNSFQLT